MPLIVNYDGELRYQQIGARAPQAIKPSPTSQTPARVPILINTSPFSPDPTTYDTAPPPSSSNDNSKAVRTIVEYFFLIMALLVASILIFRRIFYRRRGETCRFPYNRNRELSYYPHTFPRTTGLPRVNQQGYPLPDNYFIAAPLPTAHRDTRPTRSHDTDIDGRRFASPGAEIDHDGLLRGKDYLPKYESLGAPPKYAELELRGNRSNEMPSTEVQSLLPPPPPAATRNSGSMPVAPETSSPDQTTPTSRSVPLTRP